jgi:hypothetical protein
MLHGLLINDPFSLELLLCFLGKIKADLDNEYHRTKVHVCHNSAVFYFVILSIDGLFDLKVLRIQRLIYSIGDAQ